MFGKLSWKTGLAAAIILGIVTGHTCIAQTTCTYYNANTNTGGVLGGGIFAQPGAYHHVTFTVVNLTSFQLKSDPVAMLNATHGTYPFQNFTDSSKRIVVDIARGSIWAGALNDWDAGGAHYYNPRYDGIVQWELTDSSGAVRAQFEVDFAEQNNGTWISLSGMSWNGWCAAGIASAACGGIYRTESMYYRPDVTTPGTGSLNMHNIMTLGNSQFAVALYAGDNVHFVLVVREVLPGDDYYGFNLDWVDNDTGGPPGDCNK